MVAINEALIFEIIIAGWVGYRVIRFLTAGKTSIVREALVNLFFLYASFVFHVTTFPMNIVLYAFDHNDANLVPFVGTIRMLRYINQPRVVENLLGNLVLLAPLGFLLPVLFKRARRFWQVLVIGFLVSLSIELFQLVLSVRIFDIDDILINSLGVVLGFSVYFLMSKVPLFYRLISKVSDQDRRGRMAGLAAFSGFAALAFLSVYAVQIMQQTKTLPMITDEYRQQQRQLMGAPAFGDYLFILSQSRDGAKPMEIYRRVFFDRFTLFEWRDDLRLAEDTFYVSGMSTGHGMNYFVIARTKQPVAAVTSLESRFPVARVGEYLFSYARLPVDQPDRYFSFRFIDTQGNDLPLSREQ